MLQKLFKRSSSAIGDIKKCEKCKNRRCVDLINACRRIPLIPKTTKYSVLLFSSGKGF
jgi:hypothetical protein